MPDALRRALEAEPDVAYALLFGSSARGTERPDSDADVAVELIPGAARDVRTLGGLAARLTSAVGRPVDLVLLDEATPALAYRIFRDGRILVERDHSALSPARPGSCSTTSTSSRSRNSTRPASCAPRPLVVDSALVATKIAAVADASSRIRDGRRGYALATADLGDLDAFCATLARRASG